MALESTDVFVVQKQTGQKPVCKLAVSQLSAYLQTSAAVRYKGTANMTVAGDEPSPVVSGDLYINSAATTGAFAWTTGDGYTGQVEPNARALWNGTGWDVQNPVSSDIGVESIQASGAITVDSTNAASPVIGVDAATDAHMGVVQYATDADVTSGTPDLAVTSKQLWTTNQLISEAGGGTVTSVTGVLPIQVSASTSVPEVSVDYATFNTSGVTTLAADSTLAVAADDTAATPKYVSTFYLVSDFSTLADVDD